MVAAANPVDLIGARARTRYARKVRPSAALVYVFAHTCVRAYVDAHACVRACTFVRTGWVGGWGGPTEATCTSSTLSEHST